MVTFEKPAKHVALPDWHATTWEIRQTADARQSDSFNLRAEGRQLRSETDLKTKWDTYHNDARLHDRYYGILGYYIYYSIILKGDVQMN
jgi:hypothetical protein